MHNDEQFIGLRWAIIHGKLTSSPGLSLSIPFEKRTSSNWTSTEHLICHSGFGWPAEQLSFVWSFMDDNYKSINSSTYLIFQAPGFQVIQINEPKHSRNTTSQLKCITVYGADSHLENDDVDNFSFSSWATSRDFGPFVFRPKLLPFQ